jgi:alkanesulfonate monooxygenase SsuD/methylene tetrahydromethanopterin reductase-like flavin-dependent oxidoreductase (luciferase family)
MRVDVVLEPNASAARFGELAALAESYGLGTVWTANHQSSRDPFICFTGAAQATNTIRLGPVAVSPYEYHPLKMANLLFALNEISNGRTSIVVGGGGGTLTAMRKVPKRMLDGVRECVEILKAVSPDQRLNYEGDVFQIDNYWPRWATQEPPQIYVAASKSNMLRMAAKIADGIMMSDVTLPLMEESITALKESLSENKRSIKDFHINNLYAWHVKKDKDEAVREARRKIWVRGMLVPWYLKPFMNDTDCELVQTNMRNFQMSYLRDTPDVDGIPDRIMNELVENITLTGDVRELDRLIEHLKKFEAAGLNEIGLRLYDDPADSIRLIGEEVLPALH